MQRGSIAFYILLIVIVLAAILLTNGIIPVIPLSPAIHPGITNVNPSLPTTPTTEIATSTASLTPTIPIITPTP